MQIMICMCVNRVITECKRLATINGGYLLQIGCNGSRNGQLYSPSGITVYNDRLYIVDYSNGRISLLVVMDNCC